ncbi:MAG: cadherin-like domain-containing protein [Planctomycetota bacterium]
MFTNQLFRGLKSTLGLGHSRAPCRTARNALAARRLRHEPLEDRQLLSVDPGWAFGLGGAGFEVAVVAVDPGGDVYITGDFQGTADFDPAGSEPGSPNILTSGGRDTFVAAYSSAGELNWVRQFDSGGGDYGYSIATDGADVYVTGSMSAAPGVTGVFLARLNADTGAEIPINWNPQYAEDRETGASNGAIGHGIAIDSAGDIYITGELFTSTDFDGDGIYDVSPTGVPSIGERDIFVVKFDPNTPNSSAPSGSVSWAQGAGGVGNEDGLGVAVDGDGNAYICGISYSGAVNPTHFGSHTITGYSAYVAQLNADGEFTWATGLDGYQARGVAIDSSGGVYVTGSNVGVAKINPADGAIVWTAEFAASGYDVAVDSRGDVYATGYFSGTCTTGDFTLTSAGAADAFFVKLDPADGTFLWAERAGGIGGDLGTGIAVDLQGNIYTTGVFRETADFPTGDVLTSAGDGDIFLLKLGQTPITVKRTSPMVTSEQGGTATFEVVLNQTPAVGTTVTIGISSSDTSEGTVDKSSLIFTPSDWDTPHTVTVTGVDDGDNDGNIAYTIDLAPAVSLDPNFDGVDAGQVWLVNRDDETALATYANTTPKVLNDFKGKSAGVTISTITVADSGAIVDLNVQLDITHTQAEDLDVTLIGPDGTRVTLFEDVGGSANNFTGTILDDQATTPIQDGVAPFSSSYRPQDPLAALNSTTENLNGTWTLEIVDDTKFNTGTLNSWSITALYAPVVVPNSPPDAVDDSASTQMYTPVTINVLANDSDPNVGDTLSVTSVGTATNGTVIDHADGTVTYTPALGYTGVDTFDYTVSDGNGGEDTATVNVDVVPPSEATVAVNSVSRREGRSGKNTTFAFTATLDGNPSEPVVVNWTTVALAGGATPDIDGNRDEVLDDYLPGSGTFILTAADPTATFSVTVYGDPWYEADEDFQVELTYGAGQTAVGTGTIVNDDKSPSVPAASATDAALAAWAGLDFTDDDDTDPLTEGLVDDLTLMLVE